MAKQRFRTGIARGLEPELGRVDLDKHIIYGMAVAEPGEVKGHGAKIDETFIADLVRLGNETPAGSKQRFGHPAMSGNAIGSFLGRAKNFRDDRGVARADLHLSPAAARAPQGDLRAYVESLAASDAGAFGNSIAFEAGPFYKVTDADEMVLEGSADYDELAGPPFFSIEHLTAVDVVDDPAATGGAFSIFSAGLEAATVTEFLDEHPEIWQIVEANPTAMAPFFERYREYLQTTSTPPAVTVAGWHKTKPEHDSMADAITTTDEAATPAEIEAPAALEAPEQITTALETPADQVTAAAAARIDELAAIGNAFGADMAFAAVVEGIDYATAQQRHTAQLEHRVAQLEAGPPEIIGAAPVSPSSPAPDRRVNELEARIGPNLAAFARSLKLA